MSAGHRALGQLRLEAGQRDLLELAAEGALEAALELRGLGRGEEADRPVVDPEDRHAGARVAAQATQDRAVAAERQAEIGLGRQLRRSARASALDCGACWPPRADQQLAAARPRRRGRRRRTAASVSAAFEWLIRHRRLDRTAAAHSTSSAAPLGEVAERLAGAEQQEDLAVALRPGHAGGGDAERRQAERGGSSATAQHRLEPVAGIAHHAALADPAAAELELRLDHRQHPRLGTEQVGQRPQDLGEGDEADVDRDELGLQAGGQLRGAQLARVEALEHGHPRVVAQAPVELAAADIDGDHRARAAAQQAVAEASGRGADVDAVESRRVDREAVERRLELEPAAGDVDPAALDLDRGLLLEHLPRLGGALAAGADPDERRPGSRSRQPNGSAPGPVRRAGCRVGA